jgi:hypothetical protein
VKLRKCLVDTNGNVREEEVPEDHHLMMWQTGEYCWLCCGARWLMVNDRDGVVPIFSMDPERVFLEIGDDIVSPRCCPVCNPFGKRQMTGTMDVHFRCDGNILKI